MYCESGGTVILHALIGSENNPFSICPHSIIVPSFLLYMKGSTRKLSQLASILKTESIVGIKKVHRMRKNQNGKAHSLQPSFTP